MGFGLATLGYGFLLTYEAGGGIIACLIIAYGFYLASGVNKRFIAAAISALFMFPHSVFILLDVIGVVELNNYPYLRLISYSVFILAWLSMSINYLIAVKKIAADNGSKKLENKASNRLYITIFILMSMFFLNIVRYSALNELSRFIYVLQYLMILINILFLHTCFIMITTENQYKKDKKRLMEEEKKHKKQ